jgi:TPR repeat protein
MANREELAIIRGARAGQVAAQLALGQRYLFGGGGLPQNMTTALHWLNRAAQQHAPEAWILIGRHIPYALVARTARPADYGVWFERAFDAGDVPAGLVFAQLVLQQAPPIPLAAAEAALRRKALRALEAAADAGIADAQWLLAQQAGVIDGALVDPQPAASAVNGMPATPEALRLQQSATLSWASRAADSGVMPAQLALAGLAWNAQDGAAFLRRALPLARQVLQRLPPAPDGDVSESLRMALQGLSEAELLLLSRCAQALLHSADANQDELLQLLTLAAAAGDRTAQCLLGLRFARMEPQGSRSPQAGGSANYKKAIRWLTLAGERGVADAWYAMSRIYLKPEFSQRSLPDALRFLARAAEMGHAAAQLECGASAWRHRREAEANDVLALYWLQKAAAQGNADAAVWLKKIATVATPAPWAQAAQRQLTRELSNAHPFLAARIELAAVFGLSRAEALLLDVNAADREHCLLVDIRAQYARSKRRLILLQTADQLQLLQRIERLFEDVDCGPDGPEGNYRQRLYRLKTVLPLAVENEG